MSPQHKFVMAAGYCIHVMEWGRSGGPAVLILHGLARSARDHDEFAAALADTYRVIVPDLPGRGLSQWAASGADYGWHTYLPVMAELLDALDVVRAVWVGTSMGGALGIAAAGDPRIGPKLAALLLNDMGPEVPDAAFDHILSYAGTPPVFDTLPEYEEFLRKTYVGRGPIPDSAWRRMAVYGHRRTDDGRITVHNDPRVIDQIRDRRADYRQWEVFRKLTLPVLCFRGATSLLLPLSVSAAMATQPPFAQIVEVPNCGHAPGLDSDFQIDVSRSFIRKYLG